MFLCDGVSFCVEYYHDWIVIPLFGHSTLIGHVIKDFKISRDPRNKEIIYSVLGINMFKHIRIVFI